MYFLLGEIFLSYICLFLLSCFCYVKVGSAYIVRSCVNFLIFIFFIYLFILLSLYEGNLSIFTNIFFLNNFILICKYFVVSLFIFLLCVFKDFVLKWYVYVLEVIILLLLLFLALNCLLMVDDFFVFYLLLELHNFVLYFFVFLGSTGLRVKLLEVGLVYFFMSVLASLFMLYGIIGLYSVYGTLNFYFLSLFLNYELLYNLNFELVSYYFLFYFSGFFFKLGLVPFHYWLPLVYERASRFFIVLLTFGSKIVLVIFLFKLLFRFFVFSFIFDVYFILGFFSVLWGFFFSIYQYNLMKFLSYSSIYNVGFLFINLSLFTKISLFYSLIYFLLYLFSVGILISLLIIVYDFKNRNLVNSIFDLSSILHSNRYLGVFFNFIFINVSGIPPFIIFFGKLMLFFNLILLSNYMLLFILFFINALGIFYYARLLRVLNFNYLGIFYNLYVSKSIYILIFGLICLLFGFLFFDFIMDIYIMFLRNAV